MQCVVNVEMGLARVIARLTTILIDTDYDHSDNVIFYMLDSTDISQGNDSSALEGLACLMIRLMMIVMMVIPMYVQGGCVTVLCGVLVI